MQTLPNPEVRLKVKGSMLFKVNYRHIDNSFSKLSVNNRGTNMHTYIYIYIYRKSASRFSRGTVLSTLKQSRINTMRGKKDAATFPDKPVS